MRRSKFTKVKKDGGAVRALEDPRRQKQMSLLKQMLPTQDVTEHEMNFRHLFPFFFSTFERIAKKILLAQIKANFSSSDMSWDEETQDDESESDGDREVREGDEKNATVGDGKSAGLISLV